VWASPFRRNYCGTNVAPCQARLIDLWLPWCYVAVMANAGRPKQERTHSVMLRVRVTPEVDELIRTAAKSAARRKGSGDLSDWIRLTLVAAAKEELGRGEGGPEGLPSPLAS
jgi:hypothetical protein